MFDQSFLHPFDGKYRSGRLRLLSRTNLTNFLSVHSGKFIAINSLIAQMLKLLGMVKKSFGNQSNTFGSTSEGNRKSRKLRSAYFCRHVECSFDSISQRRLRSNSEKNEFSNSLNNFFHSKCFLANVGISFWNICSFYFRNFVLLKVLTELRGSLPASYGAYVFS